MSLYEPGKQKKKRACVRRKKSLNVIRRKSLKNLRKMSLYFLMRSPYAARKWTESRIIKIEIKIGLRRNP